MTISSLPLDRSASRSTTFSITELLSLAQRGRLRIPHFQRPIVWDATDVRALFDSIYRGFPIGTLLLWKQPADSATISFGPVSLEAPATSDAYVVVDGQQRLTSLIATFLGPTNNTDERFQVFFDLPRQRFVGATRGRRPTRSVPIREALESRTLLAWLRDHEDELEDGDLELADERAGSLRDYSIPAYVVEANDVRLLREVFDRVNSAGKPITRAQVFHALFASDSEPGSPATVVAELRGKNFGSLPDDRIVQSLLAIRGGDVQRDLHDEFTADEEPADSYELTTRALERAIDFLVSEGVLHEKLMPSALPLPVLAAFLHLHPDPDPANVRLLSRWLWRGWVNGFGRESGQTPMLRRAIRAVNPTKGDPSKAPSEYEAVTALLAAVEDRPVDQFRISSFRTDDSRSRLALIALARLRPLKPTGEEMDVRQSLEEHGSAAIGAYLPGPRSEVGARGFWLSAWGDLTGHEPDPVLTSHAIDSDAAAAVRAGNRDEFIRRRSTAVLEFTTTFLDSRMETGKRATPPLETLYVPDPDADQ